MELFGEQLVLRLIDYEDEDFIAFLKFNGNLSKHLTTVAHVITDFESWMAEYKRKEAAGEEYYFIIENLNGIRYGTSHIYDIHMDECMFGNFLLLPQRPELFPYESAELCCAFVFDDLHLNKIHLEVNIENFQAIQIFHKLGFKEEGRDEKSLCMSLFKEDFAKGRWRENHERYYFSWRDWF